MEKQPTLYQYTVTYGNKQVTLAAPDLGKAIFDAATHWNEEFKYIAGYCVAVKDCTARRPMCKKCGKEYGAAGQQKGTCPNCESMEARIRQDAARWKKPDRRVGDGR